MLNAFFSLYTLGADAGIDKIIERTIVEASIVGAASIARKTNLLPKEIINSALESTQLYTRGTNKYISQRAGKLIAKNVNIPLDNLQTAYDNPTKFSRAISFVGGLTGLFAGKIVGQMIDDYTGIGIFQFIGASTGHELTKKVTEPCARYVQYRWNEKANQNSPKNLLTLTCAKTNESTISLRATI